MANRKMPIVARVPGRICWSCEHVSFDCGSRGYSEMTPGEDFSLGCLKDYWDFDNYGDTLEDFRRKLQSAETCGSFQQRHAEGQ